MKLNDKSFNYLLKNIEHKIIIKALFEEFKKSDDFIFSGKLILNKETHDELQKIAKEFDSKFEIIESAGSINFYINFKFNNSVAICINMPGNPAPYGDEDVEYHDGKAYYGFGITGEWRIDLFTKEIKFDVESW